MSVIKLGRPTILEMNFPSIPDEQIAVGQWIILYDEIPVRKIGANLYEVYADYSLSGDCDSSMAERPSLLRHVLKLVEDYGEIRPLMYPSIPEPPKYTRNSRGQKKKRNYWESPMYFR